MQTGMLRLLLAISFVGSLSACGVDKVASSTFEKPDDECIGAAIPNQFLVHRKDQTTLVVHANSKDEFINGYLTENLADVEFAEYDYRVHSPKAVVAPSSVGTGAVDNWGVIRISADKLWAKGYRGDGVVVAVVDTGTDINHPQLRNQIYTNLGEVGLDANGKDKSINGIDDDSNGYIDDVTGWNYIDNSNLKKDNSIHGTHVSGIIAAAHSDTVAKATSYTQGVAPGAKILPLAFLDGDGGGSMSDGVRAIQYAVQQGASVINASWGGTQCSRTLKEEIKSLAAKNIAFVAAAGNDGSDVDRLPEYPASLNLEAQFTVGAVGSHDFMTTFSNYGVHAVHIFAPGTNVISTLPDSQLGALSGTSMSTPFVAGAIALLASAVPNAKLSEIRTALYRSAMHDSQFLNASQGRIDLASALNELLATVGQ